MFKPWNICVGRMNAMADDVGVSSNKKVTSMTSRVSMIPVSGYWVMGIVYWALFASIGQYWCWVITFIGCDAQNRSESSWQHPQDNCLDACVWQLPVCKNGRG